jgi:DNA-binding CsgD family transcriptional regulator
MALPSIISIIPPTTCIALIIIISFWGWNDKGIRIFSFLLVVLAAYGIFDVVIQNQNNIKIVADLTRLRTSLWGLIAPLSYHTIIALLKEKDKKWLYILLYMYILGAAIIILSLSGFTLFNKYYINWWGWNAVMNPWNWFFWALHAYLVTGVSAFIITLFEIRQQTENYRVRKLANVILINFIWGGTFTIIPYFILSSFNVPTEILLSYAGNVAMFLIVFAIIKYQPGKFSTDRLLSSLNPFVPAESLMLTPEKTISWISKDKLIFNGFARNDLEGTGYDKLFVNNNYVEQELSNVKTNPNYSASFETECYTRSGNTINMKISISGLRNEFNDIIAFFVVFNRLMDNTNLLDFLQTSYDLSYREKEVAALLLKEYSNIQICDSLFISLNTVKTHTRNIYQKTNTANRKEFNSLCRTLTS